jgi:hypothetical protein
VRSAGVDEYCIGRRGGVLPAVAAHDLDVIKTLKIPPSALSKIAVDFDANDVAGWPYDLSDDCRGVAGATTHVKNVVPFVQIEEMNP